MAFILEVIDTEDSIILHYHFRKELLIQTYYITNTEIYFCFQNKYVILERKKSIHYD